MGYIAIRQMQIGGKTRNPGEAVPEAAGWRSLRAYLGTHIKEVPDAEMPDAKPEATPKAAKPRKTSLPKAEPEVPPYAADAAADGDPLDLELPADPS